MPRYFFESVNGDHWRDDEGTELEGPDAAREAVLLALSDMVRDFLPNGDQQSFYVSARDEAGLIIYKATVTVSGERPLPAPQSGSL